MDGFILNIFPQGSLASSVFTTVWVGVCVVAFFNLRYGWVLSGLVVPGYLVPLLMTRPWSAAVVLLEGILTYLIVWLYSEKLSNFLRTGPLFGRDRFFALLLVSVIVRLLLDAVFLPMLGEWLVGACGINFDYRNNLYSFGLIVVALIANLFWKPGLLRGMPPLLITTGVTWLLVRYVLMEFTNFSIGNLSYMYEDLAVSMLASPKAYIVLLTTCWVASRMNLMYGWEYNGILIPALLALQWYQPMKIAATFVEAFIILGIAVLVLMLPVFKRVTMEGARKILLFFNISFVYKLALGYFMLWQFPQAKVSDYLGFGYLLPSLLALKMHDPDKTVRVMRATLQTSLVSVILAGVVGYSLTYVPDLVSWRTFVAEHEAAVPDEITDQPLAKVLALEKVELYQNRRSNSFVQPLPGEIEIFSDALKELREYLVDRKPSRLDKAAGLLGAVKYRLRVVEGRYLCLSESGEHRGWGVYVLDTEPESRMLVEVPAPLDEWGTLESGTTLFMYLGARALAVAGTGRKVNPGGASDALFNRQTLFMAFQKRFGREDTLQVRGYTASSIRVLSGVRTGLGSLVNQQPESSLWVKKSLPPGLDLSRLEKLAGTFDINWRKLPLRNALRDTMRSGFAELVLNRDARRDLMFKPMFAGIAPAGVVSRRSIIGHLQDWLLMGKESIAEKGSDQYLLPQLEDLLYFDQEVMTPLLELIDSDYYPGGWSGIGLEEISALSAAAAPFGYELVRYRHAVSGTDYLILSERPDAEPRRFWGTYVFRLGGVQDFIVQIPRPLFEVNVFEYGVSLFEKLEARCLMVGAAHPMANRDGSADLVRVENRQSLFSLVGQTVLRHYRDLPMLVLQCRAFGLRPGLPPPDVDIMAAFKSGLSDPSDLGPLGDALHARLLKDGLRVRTVDGTLETSGYEVGGLPQAMYLDQSPNKEFAILWLSPDTRAGYRRQDENVLHSAQFAAFGVPVHEEDIPDWFVREAGEEGFDAPDPELTELLRAYLEFHDIVDLSVLVSSEGYSFTRLLDINSKQSFLAVHHADGRLAALADLFPRNARSTMHFDYAKHGRTLVREFVDTRTALLLPADNAGGEK